MVKYDLRQQGFSVVEKTPKQSIITLIWICLTLFMIAGALISTFLFENADNIIINFFVGTADFICEDLFGSDSAVMTIYLIIWLLLGAALYLFIQNDLRKNKPSAVLRAVLIIMSAAAAFGFMLMIGESISALRSKTVTLSDYGFEAVALDGDVISLMLWYMVIFIFMLALYLAVKLILTVWISSDRLNSAKLKVIGKGMPVCACKEALKMWQTAVIYLVPFAFMYSLIYALNLQSNQLMIVVLMISFFMAFDLTAVIYTLYYKNKEKFDYISLDHHIYSLTFFKQAYIRSGEKKSHRSAEIPEVEDTQKKDIFEHITTCLNPECENYGLELEKSPKFCPSCGNRKYTADILANVVTCLNEECENYGHELKADIERCSLCFEKTGKLAFRFKPVLRIPTIVLSIISAYIFSFMYWGLETKSLGSIVDLMRHAAFVILIAMGFFSKSRAALIVSILSVLFTIGVIAFAV